MDRHLQRPELRPFRALNRSHRRVEGVRKAPIEAGIVLAQEIEELDIQERADTHRARRKDRGKSKASAAAPARRGETLDREEPDAREDHHDGRKIDHVPCGRGDEEKEEGPDGHEVGRDGTQEGRELATLRLGTAQERQGGEEGEPRDGHVAQHPVHVLRRVIARRRRRQVDRLHEREVPAPVRGCEVVDVRVEPGVADAEMADHCLVGPRQLVVEAELQGISEPPVVVREEPDKNDPKRGPESQGLGRPGGAISAGPFGAPHPGQREGRGKGGRPHDERGP